MTLKTGPIGEKESIFFHFSVSKEEVYLILAEDNKVIRRDVTILWDTPETLYSSMNRSNLIKGMFI